MGYLLYAIKDEDAKMFERDCQEIMGGLLEMAEGLEKDDHFRVGIFTFMEIVLLCLKEKFVDYLPKMFPHVNNAVNIDVEMKIVDAISPNSQL